MIVFVVIILLLISATVYCRCKQLKERSTNEDNHLYESVGDKPPLPLRIHMKDNAAYTMSSGIMKENNVAYKLSSRNPEIQRELTLPPMNVGILMTENVAYGNEMTVDKTDISGVTNKDTLQEEDTNLDNAYDYPHTVVQKEENCALDIEYRDV